MKVKEAFELLKDGVANIQNSDAWKEFLLFQSRFHKYSFHNTMLIYCQNPNATFTAGFNDWKKLERTVKKGEKGLKILAPRFKKVETKASSKETENKTGSPVSGVQNHQNVTDEEKLLSGFITVAVFDVSQTEGKDLPVVLSGLTGGNEDADILQMALERVIPIAISYESGLGMMKGFYDPDNYEIVINDTLEPFQRVKTLIHEYAHSRLHAKTVKDPNKPKADMEVEAEGIAFVVCSHYGIDTAEYSFPYVNQYASDPQVLERLGKTIQREAKAIIEELDPHLTPELSQRSA